MTPIAGSRILVTGVDGFTGRYLAPLLAARGAEVHGLVQSAPSGAIAGVARLHACDLTDRAGVVNAVRAVGPQRAVHLAAISFVGHGDVDAIYAVNVVGSRHLFEALAGLPAPPDAVLVASSAQVYGNTRAGALDESTPLSPSNDYAVSKAAMEMLARMHAPRLPLVVCRPFNYTGVGQADRFLLPKVVGHARRRAARIDLGNLDVARDFSDVRDVAAIYAALLLDTPAAIGRTVNVCSGRPHALSQVLELVAELSGHRMEVAVNPDFVRRDEVRVLCGDRTLLDSLLPEPNRPVELRDTLRWMLESG